MNARTNTAPAVAAVNTMRDAALLIGELLQMLSETAGQTTLSSPDDAGRLVDRVIMARKALAPQVLALQQQADQLDAAADRGDALTQESPQAAATSTGRTPRCTELTRRAAYEIEQLCNLVLRENNAAISHSGTEIDYALQGMLIRLRTLGCAVMSLNDDTPALPTDDQVDEYEAEIVGFLRGGGGGGG